MFRVTIDRRACAGIFACLVRDDRFVEGEEGLAAFDPETAETFHRDGERVTATFAEGRERAEQAAAACPPNAITVEDADAGDAVPAERREPAESGEVSGCR